jgi:DNA polymerase-3 subunit epsilon
MMTAVESWPNLVEEEAALAMTAGCGLRDPGAALAWSADDLLIRPMREIVLDTETTGLAAATDRVVEIGCVELINHIPTGRSFHEHINPECPMPEEARAVHGLTDAFLADKPRFAAVADKFLDFVGDAPLIAHNAGFDVAFINAELGRLGHAPLGDDRVIDTLLLARRRHPGGPNSLDGLCARYGIDLSRRTKHGALVDAELLAEVYIELIGGRQAHLGLIADAEPVLTVAVARTARVAAVRPVPILRRVSAAEMAAHQALLAGLAAPALWSGYRRADAA